MLAFNEFGLIAEIRSTKWANRILQLVSDYSKHERLTQVLAPGRRAQPRRANAQMVMTMRRINN
jgi:hypothetical protein